MFVCGIPKLIWPPSSPLENKVLNSPVATKLPVYVNGPVPALPNVLALDAPNEIYALLTFCWPRMLKVSDRLISPSQTSSPTLKFVPWPLLLDASIGAVKTPVVLLNVNPELVPRTPESLNWISWFNPAGPG